MDFKCPAEQRRKIKATIKQTNNFILLDNWKKKHLYMRVSVIPIIVGVHEMVS